MTVGRIIPDVIRLDKDLFGLKLKNSLFRGNGWTPDYMNAVWYGGEGNGFGKGDGNDTYRAEDNEWVIEMDWLSR